MWFKKKIDPIKIKEKNTKILQKKGIQVVAHLPIAVRIRKMIALVMA